MAVNLTMHRGDTFPFAITVTQNGSAFNLTGATIRMTAKYNLADADNAAVFTLSSPSTGITITNGPAGQATITVPTTATNTLPASLLRLYYDVQVTDSGNNVYTVVDGILFVVPDVSITTP